MRRDLRVLRGGHVLLEYAAQPSVVADTARLLAAGRLGERELNAKAVTGGTTALIAWQAFYTACREADLVEYPVRVNGGWIATIRPISSGHDVPTCKGPQATPRRLSRFAYLRRDGDELMLESPLAGVRLALGPEALAIVAALPDARRRTPADAVYRAVLALLNGANFLEPADVAQSAAAQTWEFHDALFHRASRLTHHGVGATHRLADILPPWPARKSPPSDARVPLDTPDLDACARRDRPFTTVLERRRSIRAGGERLTRGQLSELLYRTLRVRAVEHTAAGETIRRVIPSGGGLHAIEAYVAVRRCDGLRAGCYWYDAYEHALARMPARPQIAARFVDQATRSWGRRFAAPDVLITLSARLPRVAWQYEGMAYRVALLDAGAAMQTMYLVATAMDLAPCAVGNGDPDLFAALTGLDPFEETSISEFALSGRPRAGAPAQARPAISSAARMPD